ncbi:MAG: phage holin family protein [Acutalibacteraceae bacterium]
MDVVKTVKTGLWAVLGVLSSWLGVLAIPVYVLVGCNVMDYITGLLAAHRRGRRSAVTRASTASPKRCVCGCSSPWAACSTG